MNDGPCGDPIEYRGHEIQLYVKDSRFHALVKRYGQTLFVTSRSVSPAAPGQQGRNWIKQQSKGDS